MRSLTARRDSDLKCQAEGGVGLCWVPPPPRTRWTGAAEAGLGAQMLM